MKHITIIVPDGQTNFSSIACIVGVYEIFGCANEYWKSTRNEDKYRVQLAGVSTDTEFCNGIMTMKPQVNIKDIEKTHLIIIPSLVHEFEHAVNKNKLVIDWIEKQYKNGAELASMCSGTYMLASAGLLDGRNCSAHWKSTDIFRSRFPKVKLLEGRLITDEHGIYTNGGAYSFLNLAIYLVEKYFDRQTAIFCCKVFQIEIDRQSQSPFTIFTGQKMHGDEMVQKAQAYIEKKLADKISVDEISSMFAVGRRNFDRRFIKATGNTPLVYAQRVKIESAKKSLETSRKTINEVMYEVGYTDVKTFREVFRKITGMSPLEYRGRYNKEAMI